MNNSFLIKRWATTVPPQSPPKSRFERIIGYLVENRQVFLNIAGTFCLFGYVSTSYNSMRALKAEYENDREKAEEYDKVMTALYDEDWLSKVESQIRVSKPSGKSKQMLLKSLIQKKIAETLSDDEPAIEDKLFSVMTDSKADINTKGAPKLI